MASLENYENLIPSSFRDISYVFNAIGRIVKLAKFLKTIAFSVLDSPLSETFSGIVHFRNEYPSLQILIDF